MIAGLWMWLVLAAGYAWMAVTAPVRALARRRREREARERAQGIGRHRYLPPAAAPGAVVVGGDNHGTITTSVNLHADQPGPQ